MTRTSQNSIPIGQAKIARISGLAKLEGYGRVSKAYNLSLARTAELEAARPKWLSVPPDFWRKADKIFGNLQPSASNDAVWKQRIVPKFWNQFEALEVSKQQDTPKRKRGRPPKVKRAGVDGIHAAGRFEIAKPTPKHPLKSAKGRAKQTGFVAEPLPHRWKLEGTHVDLPDGRRLVMDADSGILAVMVTRHALGQSNLAELELITRAESAEANSGFLHQEFPHLSQGQIHLVVTLLYAAAKHNRT